jgi:prepilin-type N-terminal cleavage/methylation domain-containing protein
MKGFTLIELVMVLGIMAILMGMSGPFYSRFLVQNSVDNTSVQLAEELRKAQIYSMSGKQGTDWGVRYGSGVITLYAGGNTGFDERINVNPSINVTGLSDVHFNRVTGTPSAVLSVVISGNNTSRTISVNSLGVISKQ